jgi:hypothetical protein
MVYDNLDSVLIWSTNDELEVGEAGFIYRMQLCSEANDFFVFLKIHYNI